MDVNGLDKMLKAFPGNSVDNRHAKKYSRRENTEALNQVSGGTELAKKLEQMARELNLDSTMNMSYDRQMGRIIIQVLDRSTRAVIREIPSREFMEFAREFQQTLGLIANRRV